MELIYMILSEYLRENETDDTYVSIARTMILHLHEIKEMSLDQTSRLCHCSESTLNRFVRQLGLPSFKVMRRLLNHPQLVYPTKDFDRKIYREHICRNILSADQCLSETMLKNLIHEIHHA